MQFKSEVTVGTLISTLMMLGAGAAVWVNTQSEIASVKTEVVNLKETDKEMKAAAQSTKEDIVKRLDEIRADVREIRNQQKK